MTPTTARIRRILRLAGGATRRPDLSGPAQHPRIMRWMSIDRRAAEAESTQPASSLDQLVEDAHSVEVPPAELCLRIARGLAAAGDSEAAFGWVIRVVDAAPDFLSWSAGASLLDRLASATSPPASRRVTVAIAGSYTTTQLASMLRLAALRRGIDLRVHESGFGQFRQDLIDPRAACTPPSPTTS